MAPETKMEKAQRLIDTGCVKAITTSPGAGVFAVVGDTKSYLVTVLGGEQRGIAGQLAVSPGSCECEARGACSHLIAASAVFKALTAA